MSHMPPGPNYRPRIADGRLSALLAAFPAVLVNGPRAVGKTTTARQLAAAVVRLDQPAQAAAFRADPDAALRGRPEPLLLDEWQEVPGVLAAVKRSVDDDPRPGRYVLTGSVRSDLEQQVWPGTGRLTRLRMFGLTELEQAGHGAQVRTSVLDALIAGDPSAIRLPVTRPDLADYVAMALRGGFPAVALSGLSDEMRNVWVDSYLEQLLTRDAHPLLAERNYHKLARYFEALAATSAGIPQHVSLYNAAGIDAKTASAYDALLEALFVAERVPAWDTNRIDRLTKTPKRYVVDTALMGAALGATVHTVLDSDDLLGRVIDTFVMSQIRPEIALRSSRTGRFHLRTKAGEHELDALLELGGGRIVALEVKANSAPSARDARHLGWLRNSLGEKFVAGAVLHTGPDVLDLGDRLVALPICAFWG